MKPGAPAAVIVAFVMGCGSSEPRRHKVFPTSAPAEYPGVLHDPKTYPNDFMVKQTITIDTKKDGKPVTGEFDAVLQKQGDKLLILGLGPMGVKAFTLAQQGGTIEFEQFMGPDAPFSPRNVIVDVHRVFFKRLPAPKTPAFTGPNRGELDGETVEETWQEGQLRGVVFTRPGSTFKGAVRVEIGPGCDPVHCEPETAVLRNEWFGYTLSIANDTFERL